MDQIPQKASVGRDNKSFEALLLTLQIMHSYEIGDPQAEVTDEMIDIIRETELEAERQSDTENTTQNNQSNEE